jgi:hypothetical protein
MIKVPNKYKIFEFVYMSTDPEQDLGQVVEIHILPGDAIRYVIKCAGSKYKCFEDELSKEPNPNITLNLPLNKEED